MFKATSPDICHNHQISPLLTLQRTTRTSLYTVYKTLSIRTFLFLKNGIYVLWGYNISYHERHSPMSTGSLWAGFSLNTSLTLSTFHWEIRKIMPLISVTIAACDPGTVPFTSHHVSLQNLFYLLISCTVLQEFTFWEVPHQNFVCPSSLSHTQHIFSRSYIYHITNLTILNGMYDVHSDTLSSSAHSSSKHPPPLPRKLQLHFFL